MFNESVKNFMMGDVSGLSNQLQASTAARKAEGANGGSLSATNMVFASEVKRIYESEFTVTASKKETAAPKNTGDTVTKDIGDENSFAAADFTDSRLDQANDIITNALAMISDLLGLPEDTKLDSAHALQFDSECMDQLAHIMVGVDHALELLGAVSPDVHIEISVRKFVDVGINTFPFSQLKNSGEVAEFASGLRMARSHIELGLNMLNMRDVMAEKVTAKGGDPVTSGVVQAVNPSELGMSVSDTAQVFSSLIREDMAAAMERLRMITSGQAEMTELERAALNMGAIKSGILSAAMSNPEEPLAAFDFANVKLTAEAGSVGVDVGVDADVNTVNNVNVDTNINTKANANVKTNVEASVNTNVNTNVNINNDAVIDTVADTDIKVDNVVKAEVKTEVKTGINNNDVTVDNKNAGDKAVGADIKNVNTQEVDNKNVDTKNVNNQNLKKEAVHANGINGIKAESVEADVAETDNVKVVSPAVTNGKKQASANDFELPISARESVHNNKVRENVEAANRKASTSAEPLSARFVFAAADDGADVPMSVTESVSNKKVNAENGHVNTYTGNIRTNANVDTKAGADINANVFADVSSNVSKDIKDNKDSGAAVGKDVDKGETVTVAKTETSTPKAAPAAIDKGVDVPVSVSEVAHNSVKSNRGEKAVSNNINTEIGVDTKAGVNNANVKIDTDTNINANAKAETKVADNAKPAAAESLSTKFVSADDNAVEVPVSVMASAGNGKSTEKKTSLESKSAVREVLTNAQAASGVSSGADTNANANINTNVNANANINANVNTNINTDVNANTNTNTNANVNPNAAQPQSTESGVGIAFANNGESAVNGINNNDESGAELDGGDQEVAHVDSAESKATQTVDKAEKTANAFSRLENEALIRQLSERMYQAVRNGAHEIRMTLRPEALGEVRMSIRVQGDVVMARMQVENRQVKAIVESNMQSLKDDLEKHNLRLDGFSVDVGTDSDKSPRQTWREMAEASGNTGSRKFRADADGSSDDPVNSDNADTAGAALGSDTGRRFGSNTFEYFI